MKQFGGNCKVQFHFLECQHVSYKILLERLIQRVVSSQCGINKKVKRIMFRCKAATNFDWNDDTPVPKHQNN